MTMYRGKGVIYLYMYKAFETELIKCNINALISLIQQAKLLANQ